VTLADPEAYDVKYKNWNLADLPMLPEDLKLTVIKQSGKQFNAVKSQLVRNDVSDIIIATDAGREGELVARWIIEKAKVHKPVKRLWISSVTDKAIKDGFQNLKPGKAYENLYQSAVARSQADWYIGLNATRALDDEIQCPVELRPSPDAGRRHHCQTRRGNQKIPTEDVLRHRGADRYEAEADLAGRENERHEEFR
jgi:DNA topoisomerase IA